MSRSGHSIHSRTGRRWAALLGVLALVVQILLPLSQPRAAWVEEGLFPPTCSVHLADAAGTDADADGVAPGHCPLCQLAAAVAIEPSILVLPFAWPAGVAVPDMAADDRPVRAAFPPSSPPRGPPSHA
ncbi:DUF2946 family protein [Magnetospirillum sp. UT-4]|uniref:DUF2946 family protein n=1 Tax=Magnetospirillum sp. UT-4 TaxID=2681467 RepID=UPI00138298D7|nr:DUF2946 family protein [Magnetospirillum sp. UT-4]CAA7622765.1 conserved exported hypothetical protein [Magnetospirillum sp. UT-4]